MKECVSLKPETPLAFPTLPELRRRDKFVFTNVRVLGARQQQGQRRGRSRAKGLRLSGFPYSNLRSPVA